ncbi:MAG: V-type ATP synthase subunit E [Thermosphaera sp.]
MISAKRVIKEAERKAEEIIKEAEQQARKMVKEAEEQWRRKAEATRETMMKEALKEASMMLADARRKASLIIAEAKNVLIENAFAKAWELLEKRHYDVKLSLKNLLNESLQYVTKPSKILVSPMDVKMAEEILREAGYSNLMVEPSSAIKGGIIVVSEEGLIVDNTIETRFQQAKLKLLDKLAKILWG